MSEQFVLLERSRLDRSAPLRYTASVGTRVLQISWVEQIHPTIQPASGAASGFPYVRPLIIAHKVRLVRFGFDWFAAFCEWHGANVIIVHGDTLSPEVKAGTTDRVKV